jgi:putative transposase
MVYMAAIIDWHSKAVLSHRVSSTMDNQLIMSVLNDALAKYLHPEIFSTDQGSQYTSEVHTQTLDYKMPMDVCQESIKLNQNKEKAC